MTSTIKRPHVGVGILIINKRNQILLGKRKSKHGLATWGPPGGHLEFMETLEDCAMRETLEETGLKIINPKFFALTNDFFEDNNKHYVSIFMKVIYPEDQQVRNLEPHNLEQWRWFNVNELPDDLFLPLRQLVNDKNYGKKLLFINGV